MKTEKLWIWDYRRMFKSEYLFSASLSTKIAMVIMPTREAVDRYTRAAAYASQYLDTLMRLDNWSTTLEMHDNYPISVERLCRKQCSARRRLLMVYLMALHKEHSSSVSDRQHLRGFGRFAAANRHRKQWRCIVKSVVTAPHIAYVWTYIQTTQQRLVSNRGTPQQRTQRANRYYAI